MSDRHARDRDQGGHGSARPRGPLGAGATDVRGSRAAQRRRLGWVLGLTASFMLAEVAGGILSGSLALLADAGHMFTDVAAIALSLVAMRMARKPPSPEKTFGYVRTEILAALANGAALLVIAGLICWEAFARLRAPVEVDGALMLGVAAVGLAVNVVSATLLHSHARHSLNVRGAYLHVLGDLLGSVGALVAGGVILTTGWDPVDSLVSFLIAALILAGAWRLVREATDVLLEAAPKHIDVEAVLAELSEVPDLHEVHDLHVWTLTSGFEALSGHGVIDDPRHHATVLGDIQRRLRRFGIEHVTFQLEPRPLYGIPPREVVGGGVRRSEDRGDDPDHPEQDGGEGGEQRKPH